ncbi:DUF1992 domain-containing protein [Nocardioides gansuensis]|uniref:DUF1992 domain-containing protein n=1 Tax=Nocardioides gansuensis TaxID=2138300 RepID=A0A2T8FGL4_9ACTN|nr:DUF1992 domain-containing protein [Nocardioides gansuensis]PVG84844.1 DUF1992 domain-containing protein [Nocardioides gansuensis]
MPHEEPAGEDRDTRHREPERDERTGRSAAAERIRHQTQWVEQQIQAAQRRGEFDDLPGAGKPIELGEEHDPDWWLKKLVEREQISVLPPAIALRKEDAELDDRLDALTTEALVRKEVEEFNARVHHALYTTHGWPPVVTPKRDVEAEVERWRERRDARRQAQAVAIRRERTAVGKGDRPRRRLFRRRAD